MKVIIESDILSTLMVVSYFIHIMIVRPLFTVKIVNLLHVSKTLYYTIIVLY